MIKDIIVWLTMVKDSDTIVAWFKIVAYCGLEIHVVAYGYDWVHIFACHICTCHMSF